MKKKFLFFLIFFVAGLIGDLFTKWFAFRNIKDIKHLPEDIYWLIKGFCGFRLGLNKGGAFGIPLPSYFFILFSIGGIIFVWYLFKKCKTAQRFVPLILGLLLSGIVGNLYDRLLFGCVRDFILIYYYPGKPWPLFNIADSAIVISAVLLLILFWKEDSKKI